MTDGTEAITLAHMVLIALLALIVVVGIVVGMRNKRRRAKGQQEFVAHAEEAGVAIGGPETASPPPPVPVAPPPPPLADAPAALSPAPAAHVPTPAVVPPTPVDETPAEHSLADEPIAAAVAPDGTTVTIAADADASSPDTSQPEATQPATPPADGSVTQIKGLGPKVAARLGELGIDRVGQLAALDDAAAADLDARMGPFTGRIARDRWIEQARLLAAGDRDGFERVFGRL